MHPLCREAMGAAVEGREDDLSDLLARGCPPDIFEPSGWTALHFGGAGVCRILLAAGADPNILTHPQPPLSKTLELALRNTESPGDPRAEPHLEKMTLLVAAGADPGLSLDGASCASRLLGTAQARSCEDALSGLPSGPAGRRPSV